MQVSSVSDFDHFAQKVKKQTASKIEKIEAETLDYVNLKENEAEQKINTWIKQAYFEWEQERYAQEQQSRIGIAEEMNRQWSVFKNDHRSALILALRLRLEQIFPKLAECFISKISQQYRTGSFIMPESYMSFVTTEGFILEECEKEEIIFRNGNLYIEYSVERIIEELNDEITSHFKEDRWQV